MKKSGKKKPKTKKKTNEPEMTWKEAIIAYQINIKEKALEDVKYEMKILEDNKTHLTARISVLKTEQAFLMDDLVKSSKIPENNENEITKEKVIKQMKENWAQRTANAKALEEFKKTLMAKSEEIFSQQHQLKYWRDYRDRGQEEQLKQIQLLQQNNADMETTFETMTGYMLQSSMKSKEEIEKNTAEVLDQQKYSAAEKAIARMDKYSKQEAIDHDWLLHEIEIHRRETAELLQLVEKLENENLHLLSELFQCQLEDLRVSRGFLLTELPDYDDLLDDRSFLEIDLSRLRNTGRDLYFHNDGDEDEAILAEGENGESALVECLQRPDFDLDDFHRVGLRDLDLKSMNVAGKKLRIHKPKTPSVDEIKARLNQPDIWPVTKSMLLDAIDSEPLCDQTNQSP